VVPSAAILCTFHAIRGGCPPSLPCSVVEQSADCQLVALERRKLVWCCSVATNTLLHHFCAVLQEWRD